HARLRPYDQFEAAKGERVGRDQVQAQPVAIIAGLDAVDLPAKLVLELGDVLEALQPRFIGVGGNGERVLGALQVDADVLDGLVLQIGLYVGFHGRHPVAQEDVDVLVLERGVGDRHRKHLYVRAVAQGLENDGGGGRGGGDVRPTDICEMYSLAAFRLGREARTGSQESRQANAGGD